MKAGKRGPSGWLKTYAVAFVIFLYLPVTLIPIFSFNNSPSPRFPLSGFTTKWYEGLPRTPALLEAAWNSLLVGVSAAILATVLGICAARAVTRYRFRGQRAMHGLIMAPLLLPEIIVAVSMLIIILALGMPLTLLTVTLGHVLICIPYSISVLISGFEGFDRSIEEASADLGETAWGTFRRVTLPMMTPAIISSMLVAFTISLDDFIMAFFLGGNDATLPVYIWGQLRFAARLPGVLALGSLLLAASIMMLTIAEIMRRRAAARANMTGGLLA
ncbi:MAG: ABC transporter permease [Mesorhizobium sp.]